MAGGKIEREFKTELESNPVARVRVIVRTRGDPRQLAGQIIGHGLAVRHTYSLIRAVAAEGLASAVLKLADEPWVEKIEPDREVRTME
jgi:hypothetical protein